MHCANCGYENVPGTGVCARCGNLMGPPTAEPGTQATVALNSPEGADQWDPNAAPLPPGSLDGTPPSAATGPLGGMGPPSGAFESDEATDPSGRPPNVGPGMPGGPPAAFGAMPSPAPGAPAFSSGPPGSSSMPPPAMAPPHGGDPAAMGGPGMGRPPSGPPSGMIGPGMGGPPSGPPSGMVGPGPMGPSSMPPGPGHGGPPGPGPAPGPPPRRGGGISGLLIAAVVFLFVSLGGVGAWAAYTFVYVPSLTAGATADAEEAIAEAQAAAEEAQAAAEAQVEAAQEEIAAAMPGPGDGPAMGATGEAPAEAATEQGATEQGATEQDSTEQDATEQDVPEQDATEQDAPLEAAPPVEAEPTTQDEPTPEPAQEEPSEPRTTPRVRSFQALLQRRVRRRAAACYRQHGGSDPMQVTVTVDRNGIIRTTRVNPSGGPIASCISASVMGDRVGAEPGREVTATISVPR
jgi:hypothetical protein